MTPDTVAQRYRILRKLAAGGMGEVFEAEHIELGRRVALKRMLREFTNNEELLRRFENEARATARIGHPGIVDVIDLGTDERGTYIVMEFLKGEELEARLKRDRQLPIDEVVRLGKEIADAVSAAHEAGIVHRDLKPANVFLCEQRGSHSRVKLLDFGIAKLLFESDEAQTRTGAVLGTPLYMAPEQLRDSKQVDERADVYSVGAILYHALSGAPPLNAPTLPELIFKVAAEVPPHVSTLRPDVPPWLDGLIQRMLTKDPHRRVASMQAVLQALEAQSLTGTVVLPSEAPPAASQRHDAEQLEGMADRGTHPALARTGQASEGGRVWFWIAAGVIAAAALGFWYAPSMLASEEPLQSGVAPRVPAAAPVSSAVSSQVAPSEGPAPVLPVASASVSTKVRPLPLPHRPSPKADTPPAHRPQPPALLPQ